MLPTHDDIHHTNYFIDRLVIYDHVVTVEYGDLPYYLDHIFQEIFFEYDDTYLYIIYFIYSFLCYWN